MEQKGPQPERFKEYTEAEDGSGFYLDDNPHFFAFHAKGGWFDEFGNYYDSDGIPRSPPGNDVAEEDLEDDEDELNDGDLDIEDPIEFDDELIDEYEEGAKIRDDADVEEVEEEYDEATEQILSTNLEKDGRVE